MQAQTTSGLIAYYNFDNQDCDPFDATGNGGNTGILQIDPAACECGVLNSGIDFTSGDNWFTVAGSSVLDLFETEDFTISMYIKAPPALSSGPQVLLSKRSDDCAFSNSFEITYDPNSQFVSVLMQENDNLNSSVRAFAENNSCWQLITVMREGLTTYLYINGELKDEVTTAERVDLTNNNVLTIGKASCDLFETNFFGIFDEIRFYNRALQPSELEELNFSPDRIANSSFSRDTLIFLGDEIPTYLSNTCAESFAWSPEEQICDDCEEGTDAEPILLPQTTTTYTVSMTDNLGCVSQDTFRVTVIDPDTLDCSIAFLPKAFTPNFDGLNDTYGIDNPLVLDELISFEIYDKWGERVFYTTNPRERWNGSFKEKEMLAGVYLYKVVYVCDGVERNKTDSFTVLR